MHKNKIFLAIKKIFNTFIRFFKKTFWVLLILLALLSLEPVQSRLGRLATNWLNNKYHTDIQVNKVFVNLFGKISLKDVFIKDHQNDTLIFAKKINTSISGITKIINGHLFFKTIEIENLLFNMKTHRGDSISNLDVFINSFNSESKNTQSDFLMKCNHISLKNCDIKISDQNTDNNNIEILNLNNFNSTISNFSILNSDVNFNLLSSNGILNKNTTISNLSTKFNYTPSEIKADSLTISTPHSNLLAELRFIAHNNSFANFIDKVNIQADIKKSTLNTNDINAFYNAFTSEKQLTLEVKAEGTLQNIFLKNTKLYTDNTLLKGSLNLKNLFNNNIEIYGTNVEFSSIYSDLIEILPKHIANNIPKNIRTLAFFKTNGNFEYTSKKTTLNLNINSKLGNILTNGFIENLTDLNNSTYQIQLKTNHFEIGKFINDTNLGFISCDINLQGKSLNINNINKTLGIIKIQKLNYKNYTYNNANAIIEGINNHFISHFFIDDPNLKINAQASINFNKTNQYKINADIQKAKLHSINLVKKDSIANFKGNITISLQGNELNTITGKANFANISYLKNQTEYNFKNTDIQIDFNKDKERIITFSSTDMLNGKISGIYNFEDIGKIFQNSIGSFYTNYRPFKIKKGQYLSFDFNINSKIIEVFFSEISLSKDTFFKGNIVADMNDFKVDFQSSNINAYGATLKKVNFSMDNKNPVFNTLFEIASIKNSNYNISDFTLTNVPRQDTLLIKTQFKGGKWNQDSFVLDFYHTINKKQSSVFGFKTSDIFYKGNHWIINKDNEKNRVIFNKKLDSITIENFKIQNQEQFIALRGKMAKNHFKDIYLIFNKIELKDILPDIENTIISGTVNGQLSLLQQKEKYFPSSSIVVDNFSLNDISMGDIEIGIQGNENLSSFKINTQIVNDKSESFRINGDLFFKDKKTYIDVFANIHRFNLAPFNLFLDGIFENLRGKITGDAHINGLVSNPKINGIIHFENTGFGIPYLKVDTEFDDNASISLENNNFIFNNIKLTDTQFKTQATLSGKIFHKNFSSWFLDINIDTNNQRFLALNTQAKDNDLFYGTGFINGKASITGQVNDLTISVNASTSEGTKFKIPLNETKTVGDDSFINFINKKNNEEIENQTLKTFNGIEMNFELNILPSAEIEVIIDPKTGSNLIGKGVGTLLLEINTNGKFNMWGDFITTSGEYNFKYESIIDKKFKVLPGGSILWNGDPLNAELENLKAVYSLLSNPSVLLESNQYNRKIQTQVEISIEGSLTHPKTIFNILFPDSSPALVSELNYRLKDLDKKQLQAFSLLLQGNFLSDTSAGEKVISHNMLETATGIVNQLFAGDDNKLNLGISYEKSTIDPSENYQNNDRLGITVSTQITDNILFNGKIAIPVGGTTQTAIAGDFEIQFLLTKDGNLSAKIFNRENEVQQYLLDKIGYTQGIGISYKVDFDTFKGLIESLFKKTK